MGIHENKQIIKPKDASEYTPYFVLAKDGPIIIPGIGEKIDGKWQVQWYNFSERNHPIYNEKISEGLDVWACTPTFPEYGADPV